MSGKRIVVSGPPRSGKTTWVEAHRKAGDVVWDLDKVADTMLRLPLFPRPSDVTDLLEAMKNALIEWLRLNRHVSAYIIIADALSAQSVATRIGGEVKFCVPERVKDGGK